ncbi:MAG TPA: hypothetical protein VK694_02055 [Verrucomicrobiae bacterium]|nr:hypothetical protein [Verrucomicrobiae bacterium]
MSETYSPINQEMHSLDELRQQSPLDGIEQQLPQDAAIEFALRDLRQAVETERSLVDAHTVQDAQRFINQVGNQHEAAATIATAQALEAAGHVSATKLSEIEQRRLEKDTPDDSTARYHLARTTGPHDRRAVSPIEDRSISKQMITRELAAEVTRVTAPQSSSEYLHSQEGQAELTRVGLEGFDKAVAARLQVITGAASDEAPTPQQIAEGLRTLTQEMHSSQSTLSNEVLEKLEEKGVLMSAEVQQQVLSQVLAGAPERFASVEHRDHQIFAAAKVFIGFASGGGEVYEDVLAGQARATAFHSAFRSKGQGEGSGHTRGRREAPGAYENNPQDNNSSIATEGPLAGRRLAADQLVAYNQILTDNPHLATGEGTAQDFKDLAKKYHNDSEGSKDGIAFGVVSMIKEDGGFKKARTATASPATAAQPKPTTAPPEPSRPEAPVGPLALEAAPAPVSAEADKGKIISMDERRRNDPELSKDKSNKGSGDLVEAA